MNLRLVLGGTVGVAVLVIGVGVASLGAKPQVNTARHEVTMRGNSFRPRSLSIELGDTVEWVNRDIVRHNAVRADVFDTGELRGGERYVWVPTDTGSVRYECTIHERMRGVVHVRGK